MVEPEAGAWRALATDDGSLTLAHPEHGEACHSSFGARRESRERYVAGCGFPLRWLEDGERSSAERPRAWRVLDVGTGLGWNLAATLEARDELPAARRPALELVTLERSRAVLEAAFALQVATPQGPALARVHAALAAGLAAPGAHAVEAGVTLRLLLGDARASLGELAGEPPFDAIYHDPFSPRREGELWSVDVFRSLRALAAPGARLATYSAATAVRAGLAAAGWDVAPGPRVGAKAQGTLAAAGAAALAHVAGFDLRTARRLERRAQALAPAGGVGSLRTSS